MNTRNPITGRFEKPLDEVLVCQICQSEIPVSTEGGYDYYIDVGCPYCSAPGDALEPASIPAKSYTTE